MGLQNHTEAISKVAEVAGKEFSIEKVSTVLSTSKLNGTCMSLASDSRETRMDSHGNHEVLASITG